MSRFSRVLPILKFAAGIAILFVALYAVRKELANFHWSEFLQYVQTLAPSRVASTIALAGVCYLVMTGYDAFAFRYIDRELPYPKVALASFTAYAINNNLGMSGVVGTGLRYRFYTSWNVRPSEIAKIFVFCTVTYWLGFVLLGGLVFVSHPPDVPATLHLPFASIRILGLILLTPGLAYAIAALRSTRTIRIRSFLLQLPDRTVFLGQIAISMADWALAGLVFAMLMPRGLPLAYIDLLSIFLLAQTGGLVSNVPGGIGIFEAIALAMLHDFMPPAQILSVLVAFRGIYFVLPLLVALVTLAVYSVKSRRRVSTSS